MATGGKNLFFKTYQEAKRDEELRKAFAGRVVIGNGYDYFKPQKYGVIIDAQSQFPLFTDEMKARLLRVNPFVTRISFDAAIQTLGFIIQIDTTHGSYLYSISKVEYLSFNSGHDVEKYIQGLIDKINPQETKPIKSASESWADKWMEEHAK